MRFRIKEEHNFSFNTIRSCKLGNTLDPQDIPTSREFTFCIKATLKKLGIMLNTYFTSAAQITRV